MTFIEFSKENLSVQLMDAPSCCSFLSFEATIFHKTYFAQHEGSSVLSNLASQLRVVKLLLPHQLKISCKLIGIKRRTTIRGRFNIRSEWRRREWQDPILCTMELSQLYEVSIDPNGTAHSRDHSNIATKGGILNVEDRGWCYA